MKAVAVSTTELQPSLARGVFHTGYKSICLAKSFLGSTAAQEPSENLLFVQISPVQRPLRPNLGNSFPPKLNNRMFSSSWSFSPKPQKTNREASVPQPSRRPGEFHPGHRARADPPGGPAPIQTAPLNRY